MIRTQVQFTQDQWAALRRLSAATGKSIAELVRDGIDQYLTANHSANAEDRIARALRVAGKFSSGVSDVSAAHDRHLAEAFQR